MERTGKQSSSWWLMVLALALAVTLTAFFWPGVGTWETLHYAAQKRLPVMHDWQSAFVAYLYWWSSDLFESTGPVLLLQQFVFWAGLWLIAVNTLSRFAAQAFFLLAVAVLPPVWVTEIMLWKEAWTLSFLAVSIGGCLALLRTGRWHFLIIAGFASVGLAATRQNAILLAWPALWVIAMTLREARAPARRSLFGGTAVLFAGLLVLLLTIIYGINKLNKQRCYIWHQALLWDLVAISIEREENLLPAALHVEGLPRTLDYLGRYFTIHYSDPLFSYQGSPLKLYGTPWDGCANPPPVDLVLDHWFRAVLTYPGAYAKHRLTYFAHLLDIFDKDATGAAYYPIDSEVSARTNQAQRFNRVQEQPWYRAWVHDHALPGWLYPLVTFAALLGFPPRRSRRHIYLWLLWLAGLAYLGSFLVIGSGAVLRYLSVFAVLGPSLLAARHGGAGRANKH